MSPKTLPVFVTSLLCLCTFTFAHDNPTELSPPKSDAEAWNVIEQCKTNIDQLLLANLTRDVAGQLANIATALRQFSSSDRAEVKSLVVQLEQGCIELLHKSRLPTDAVGETRTTWKSWGETLVKLEALYPADVVHADVYICPMHPLDRHLKADDKCSVCGMSLTRRHLPASSVYLKPGEATLKMSAACPPLVVGQKANVIIKLTKSDGSPVSFDDLLEVHTKKIHLLINDQSLSDYHHEHPAAAENSGEYRFEFTPTKPGPYRLWADVVPIATGVQEYVIADLSADTKGETISDKETKLTSVVDGLNYELTFATAGKPIHAGETIVGSINITAIDGKGFTALEPVMGSFAHIVGFSEDGKTVLHIHPFSKTPSGPNDRGGPVFAFKFYSPASGFLRLYCQVQVEGKQKFAPFNLTVLPPEILPVEQN